MSIKYLYQRLNKAANTIEEQCEFTNDAAIRAFLRLQARLYLNNNDAQQERFDAFIKQTYPDQHTAALNELAANEEVVSRFDFATDAHVHILNVHLVGSE